MPTKTRRKRGGRPPPPKETDEMKEGEGGEATHNLQSFKSAHQVGKCSTNIQHRCVQEWKGKNPPPPEGDRISMGTTKVKGLEGH